MKTEKYTLPQLIEILEAKLLQMHDHNDYTVNRVDRLSPCCAEYTIEHKGVFFTFTIREGHKEDLNKAITECNKALRLAQTEKKTNITWSKMEDLQFHNTRTDYETGVTYTYAAETTLKKEGNRIASIERWGSRGFGSLYIVWIFDNTKKESQKYEFTNTSLKIMKKFAIDKIQEKEEKPKNTMSLLDHMKSGQYLFLEEVVQYLKKHYKGKFNTEIQGDSSDPALRITAYKEKIRTEISFFFYPTSFTSVDVHLFVDRALYIEDNCWLDDLAHSHKETMTVRPASLTPHEIGAKLLMWLD